MAEPYNSAPEKAFVAVESIPLAEAVLCANCGCITRARNGHCLVCAGHSIVNLGRVLDREPGPIRLTASSSAEPGMRFSFE
jgi:hypothetical protein